MCRRAALDSIDAVIDVGLAFGPVAIAVYSGGRLIGFDETVAHAYLAHHYGDDCGDECRAAGHVVLL